MGSKVKPGRRGLSVDIIIPCLNEAETLEANILTVKKYLDKNLGYNFTITIVDSGSLDGTLEVAQKLSGKYKQINVVIVELSGRGLAIKRALKNCKSDVFLYMDEDLATDLSAIKKAVDIVAKNKQTIVVGSRYDNDSRVTRGFRRTIYSVSYSLFARLLLRIGIKDYQCGFKAFRVEEMKELVKEVENNHWFFDTEILVRAYDAKMTIKEIPIKWTEVTDSRVRILSTANEFISGLDRLTKQRNQIINVERLLVSALVLVLAALLTPALWLNGWANTYYSMATLAGTQSWKALFFGSLDSANFISLDKPPFVVWVSAVFGRIIGFSPVSVLLPHLLAGLAALLLIHTITKRLFGIKAGLLAGFVFALSPISVVAFRYNNPDALLTLSLVLGLYFFVRALESGVFYWLLLTGLMFGVGFNTKMLQALIPIPVLFGVYMLYSKREVMKRFFDMTVAGIGLLVGALWWPVVVWLTPPENRPFIGGTSSNSIWELIVGYNGFNRLLGNNWQQPTGNDLGAGFGGNVGLLRIFNESFGPVIAWLLPVTLVIGFLLLTLYKTHLNRMQRALVATTTGWILIHSLVFGFTKGTLHPHYAIVIMPALAILAGVGYWLVNRELFGSGFKSPAVILTAIILSVSAALMPLIFWSNRDWPSLISTTMVLAALAGLWLFQVMKKRGTPSRIPLLILTTALFIGPLSSAIASSTVKQKGLIIFPAPLHEDVKRIRPPEDSIPDSLKEYLTKNIKDEKWIASTATAYDAAAIGLSTRRPVMVFGGFSGVDNPLSLGEFQQLVKEGKVRYFVVNRRQSSEVKRCGIGFSASINALQLADGNCKVDPPTADQPSAANIAVWAQQQKEIAQDDFGDWELFDLKS